MKKCFIVLFIFFNTVSCYAQSLEGKWKGHFIASYDSIPVSYAIDFFTENGKTIALTNTEFKIGNQLYYSTCMARVTIDSLKQKIVVIEYKSLKTNAPTGFSDCFQKHTLWFLNKDKDEFLTGSWETAGNKTLCGIGSTVLQRIKNLNATNQN
jgi:hypothetical protein